MEDNRCYRVEAPRDVKEWTPTETLNERTGSTGFEVFPNESKSPAEFFDARLRGRAFARRLVETA